MAQDDSYEDQRRLLGGSIIVQATWLIVEYASLEIYSCICFFFIMSESEKLNDSVC
jgi:hypothetical protein